MLILNCQGPGPLIGGQTFLQGELGVFASSPRAYQQSAMHCFLLQDKIQSQLPGSARLRCTQKCLRPAKSNPEHEPSTLMDESVYNAESQVRQTIHLRPRLGMRCGNLRCLRSRLEYQISDNLRLFAHPSLVLPPLPRRQHQPSARWPLRCFKWCCECKAPALVSCRANILRHMSKLGERVPFQGRNTQTSLTRD